VTGGAVRMGVLIWAQHAQWSDLLAAAQDADRLGFEHLWCWDHLLPLHGRSPGPIFEPMMTLAGWASVTTRATLGLMVGANTFRNPLLLAKMTTTLDHLSGGRAAFGLGAAWYEPEHRAFGLPFGSSVGERLDWLEESAGLVAQLFRSGHALGQGPHYGPVDVVESPRPVQPRLRLLIGGSGERRTLATVARHADAWNAGGGPDEVRHKDAVLREWCARLERDEAEIERTVGVGPIVIRRTVREARLAAASIADRNMGQGSDSRAGTSASIADQLVPYVELGFRTIHLDLPAPYDRETLERLASEVRPVLQAAA
jgi:alkanesulfonate monooxygenase SsuD/methylene tetrahydromethanopterin reductase-like flavin-dependent oxidoreductase (luciferase family)